MNKEVIVEVRRIISELENLRGKVKEIGSERIIDLLTFGIVDLYAVVKQLKTDKV